MRGLSWWSSGANSDERPGPWIAERLPKESPPVRPRLGACILLVKSRFSLGRLCLRAFAELDLAKIDICGQPRDFIRWSHTALRLDPQIGGRRRGWSGCAHPNLQMSTARRSRARHRPRCQDSVHQSIRPIRGAFVMLPAIMDMSVRAPLLAEKPQTWAVRVASIGGVQWRAALKPQPRNRAFMFNS
jgi:hypothetical protein